MTVSKRSPEDIVSEIEASEANDAIDRVLAMSPEERRRELEESKVDVAALHAKADAFYAQVQAAAGDPPVAKVTTLPTKPKRPARAAWVISLLAAALGGVLLFVMGRGEVRVASPPHATAEELRTEAYAACEARLWRQCEQKLDAAKEVDPEGEKEARVIAARKALREGTSHE